MLDASYYEKTDEIIACHTREERSLIPIIQDIQEEYRYLPPELLSYVAGKIGISEAKAFSDPLFALGYTWLVSCLGACGLAPAVMINDEVYGKMTPEKMSELIKKLREE